MRDRLGNEDWFVPSNSPAAKTLMEKHETDCIEAEKRARTQETINDLRARNVWPYNKVEK